MILSALWLFLVIGRPAFDVVNFPKRATKCLFLFLAVRTPVQPIHDCSFIREALSKSVDRILRPHPAQIPRTSKSASNQDKNRELASRSCKRARGVLLFLLWLRGHEFLTSYITTRIAWCRTFRLSQWSVATSPSIMTSTGASSKKSTCRTPLRSASGCCVWVPV